MHARGRPPFTRAALAVVILTLSALVVHGPAVPAETAADGAAVHVDPHLEVSTTQDALSFRSVTAADGRDYYLFTVRALVKSAEGTWRDLPLDPAEVTLRLRSADAPDQVKSSAPEDSFAFAADATRVLVAFPADRRPNGPVLLEAVVRGHVGAYNPQKRGAPPDAVDALDATPVPVTFEERNVGRLEYSATLEVLAASGAYDVRVTTASPFAEETTLRAESRLTEPPTPHGSSAVALNSSAPATAHFAHDPLGVVAETDGARFVAPARATYGGPVAKLMLCRTGISCVSSLTSVLSLVDVTADASASYSPPREALAYAWDWDDGTTETGWQATHAWVTSRSYTMRLTVTDESGRASVLLHPVTVLNRAPSGVITVSPTEPNRATETTVEAVTSDPDGSIVHHRWAWNGITQPSTGSTLSFPKGALGIGTHFFRVVFTDDAGGEGATTVNFTVVNLPPTPAASVSNRAVRSGTVVTFTDRSYDLDGGIASRNWDLGDGTVIDGHVVQHVYTKEGRYVPRLTVVDGEGKNATATVQAVHVDDTPPVLRVDARPTPPSGWHDASPWFVITKADALDPNPAIRTTVDGSPVPLSFSVFYINEEGTHDVLVTATDWVGNAVEHSATVKVDLSPPTVSFEPPEPFASGVETVEILAEDAWSGVARVELYANGVLVAANESAGPFAAKWDTCGITVGKVVLKARAVDVAGHAREVEKEVLVVNIPEAPSAPDAPVLP